MGSNNLSDLSERERRFVYAYTGDALGNASKAAELAGYSPKSAGRIGYRLSKRVHVQEAIAARQGKMAAKADITVERVLRELSAIAFSDIRALYDEHGRLRPIHELPEEAARALAGIEVTKERTSKDGDTITQEFVSKVRTWDKPKALELLGKHLGILNEKAQGSGITVNIGFLAPHTPDIAITPRRGRPTPDVLDMRQDMPDMPDMPSQPSVASLARGSE